MSSAPTPPPEPAAPDAAAANHHFQDLLRRAAANDQEAARELFLIYRGYVLSKVRRLMLPRLRQFCDSADVTQQVWIGVFKTLAGCYRFSGPAAFVGFLYAATQHKLLDAERYDLHTARRGGGTVEPLAEYVDPAAGPEQVVDEEDLWRHLSGRLEPHERAALEGVRAGEKMEALARSFGLSLRQLRRIVWDGARRVHVQRALPAGRRNAWRVGGRRRSAL